MASEIKSFEDLDVWQRAQDLAVEVYYVTKRFPVEERYGLVSQMRRAATSISANVAEGFGRRTTNNKKHFYTIAYGSALETRSFLYLSHRLGYVDEASLSKSLGLSTSVQKLINALIRGLK